MKDVAGRVDDVTVRRDCQDAARRLIAKYSWGLLSEGDLAARVLRSIRAGGAPGGLDQQVLGQYTLVLYDSCRQLDDQYRREQAFGELFRYLYRVAYNRWPELAEEAAQRALELVFEKLADCRTPAAFLYFALCQLRRAFTELNRVRARAAPGAADGVVAEPSAPSQEAMLLDRECLRLLLERLARLPEKQRQVIFLKFFEGLSDEEISARVELSVNNVRVQRHRILERLRQDQQLREACIEI